MRYLPNRELQQDNVVDDWLALIGDLPPWPNPGRLGQYEAALAWSLDTGRTNRWPQLQMPCLVLSFEYDVDSPPNAAQRGGIEDPDATFVEVPGASHLGVFTHSEAVATEVIRFLADSDPEVDRAETPATSNMDSGDKERADVAQTGPDRARVDQWLWSVRIYRTRSAATEACRAGHVRVNGTSAKPATPVRVGDEVSLRAGGPRPLTRSISNHSRPVGSADRRSMFDRPQSASRSARGPAHSWKGRGDRGARPRPTGGPSTN